MKDQEAENIDGCCQSATFVKPETPNKVSRRSEDALVLIATTKALQKCIRKELTQMTEPFLNYVTDSTCELLQYQISLKSKILSDEIANVLVEDVTSLEEKAAASTRPTSKKTSENREKLFLNGVAYKTNTFFATWFAKLAIHQIAAQYKVQLFPEYQVRSKDSMQSFLAEVDSLLLTEDATKQQEGNELVFCRLQDISNSKVLRKELIDLLYN